MRAASCLLSLDRACNVSRLLMLTYAVLHAAEGGGKVSGVPRSCRQLTLHVQVPVIPIWCVRRLGVRSSRMVSSQVIDNDLNPEVGRGLQAARA